MKKMIVILAALVVTLSASAQKRGGVYVRPRTHVVIAGGYSPYFYSPFYNPWYSPFYNTPHYYNRPSKLDMQIADIKSDYSDRIWSVKHDKSMSGRERRQEVWRLKHERDKAVMDAKVNYHRTRR